jgi:hypothetical protein
MITSPDPNSFGYDERRQGSRTCDLEGLVMTCSVCGTVPGHVYLDETTARYVCVHCYALIRDARHGRFNAADPMNAKRYKGRAEQVRDSLKPKYVLHLTVEYLQDA